MLTGWKEAEARMCQCDSSVMPHDVQTFEIYTATTSISGELGLHPHTCQAQNKDM